MAAAGQGGKDAFAHLKRTIGRLREEADPTPKRRSNMPDGVELAKALGLPVPEMPQ